MRRRFHEVKKVFSPQNLIRLFVKVQSDKHEEVESRCCRDEMWSPWRHVISTGKDFSGGDATEHEPVNTECFQLSPASNSQSERRKKT